MERCDLRRSPACCLKTLYAMSLKLNFDIVGGCAFLIEHVECDFFTREVLVADSRVQ